MSNRIPLITIEFRNVTDLQIEKILPITDVVDGSELHTIISKINKPFKLVKIYNGDFMGYYAEFENEIDTLEYSLKINTIHYGQKF